MSLIYLDNSATSFPKAPGTADAVKKAILTSSSSGRASYDESLSAGRLLYSCREKLAELFSVRDSSRIILNSGATESLNTVLRGFVQKGMKILTSPAEHNSVMRPLHYLEREKEISVGSFNCCKDGSVHMDSFLESLKNSPDLLILSHSSNVTGAVFPIGEMIESARKSGVTVCVDGAQSAGHELVNLTELDADFYCFSGHKGLLGPAGTGGFYIKEGLKINPLIFGGTGSLSEEEIQPEFLPDSFESGTRNIPGLAGLSESVSFILTEGINNIKERESILTEKLINGLKEIPGITIHGPDDKNLRNSVISLTHDTMAIDELAEGMDDAGIAQRMGLHCSPAAHKVLGTFQSGGTIRLSPGYFNSEKDIENTLLSIRNIINA